MRIPGLSTTLITVDRIMDYIPFAGIVNNVVDVALKALLYFVPQERKEKVHYFRHLDQKTVGASTLYAVPFVGTVAKIIQLVRSSDPVKEFETKKKERENLLQERQKVVKAYQETEGTQDHRGVTDAEKEAAEAKEKGEDEEWIRTLYVAADAGVIQAMKELVTELEYKNQHGEAIFWYKRAATSGDLEAIKHLAHYYDELNQHSAAIPYWIQAAKKGDEDAKNHLHVGYNQGQYGCVKDLSKALEYCANHNDRWGVYIDILEDAKSSAKEKLAAAHYLYSSPMATEDEKKEYGYKAASLGDQTIPAFTVFGYKQDKVARAQAKAQKDKDPSSAGYLYAMMVDLGLGGTFEMKFNPQLFNHLAKTAVQPEVLEVLAQTYQSHDQDHPDDVIGARARAHLPFIQEIQRLVKLDVFVNEEEKEQAAYYGNLSAIKALAGGLESTDTERAVFWLDRAARLGDPESIELLAHHYLLQKDLKQAFGYAKQLNEEKLVAFGNAALEHGHKTLAEEVRKILDKPAS